MVAATVIIINSVFGGFRGVDLMWLAALTVRLKVSNYSWLSDCTVRLQLYRLISAKIKQLKYMVITGRAGERRDNVVFCYLYNS